MGGHGRGSGKNIHQTIGSSHMMMHTYFKSLYQRTMREAYAAALREVVSALADGGKCLDCGAKGGQTYDAICREIPFSSKSYFGLEWNHASIRPGRQRGLSIIQGDLNYPLPYQDRSFDCVFALSVLEHLTNGCRFILECYRILQPQGRLIRRRRTSAHFSASSNC